MAFNSKKKYPIFDCDIVRLKCYVMENSTTKIDMLKLLDEVEKDCFKIIVQNKNEIEEIDSIQEKDGEITSLQTKRRQLNLMENVCISDWIKSIKELKDEIYDALDKLKLDEKKIAEELNSKKIIEFRKILKWKTTDTKLESFIKQLELNSLIEIKEIDGKFFIKWNETHILLIAIFKELIADEKFTNYYSINQLSTVCKKHFIAKNDKPYNFVSLKTIINQINRKAKIINSDKIDYAREIINKIRNL